MWYNKIVKVNKVQSKPKLIPLIRDRVVSVRNTNVNRRIKEFKITNLNKKLKT